MTSRRRRGRCWRADPAISAFGVGSCRSSPTGGGGPCEAWWKGTGGVSCPLYVTRPRPCPSTTFGGPPPRSGGDRQQSVATRRIPYPITHCRREYPCAHSKADQSCCRLTAARSAEHTSD